MFPEPTAVRRPALLGLAVLGVVIALGLGGVTAADAAARSTRLVVSVEGLPAGERPAVSVRRGGRTWAMRSQRLVLRHAKPGRYVVVTRTRRIAHTRRTVRRGALAYALKRRTAVTVRRGATTTAVAVYSTIVNPRVTVAPAGLESVIGDPANPDILVYPDRAGLPGRGTIMTAAPSPQLPKGLVAEVTANKRLGSRRMLSLQPAEISDAIPSFEFNGAVPLSAAASGARAATAECNGPRDFDSGAKLDEFVVRQASAKLSPPQMSFTLAIRTTERFGPRLAAAGVACSWDLGGIANWPGAIPTPVGVPIPVFATIPVKASATIEGSLSAFKLNVASTSVLNVELGAKNDLSFWQEGSNVWIDGALQMAGKAKFSVTLSLVLGVGHSTVGNLHVSAGFGPTVTFTAGVGCKVDLALGALSAGVKIGPLKKDSPPYSPFSVELYNGCKDASAPPDPGGGAGAGTGGTGGGGTGGGGTGGGGGISTPRPTATNLSAIDRGSGTVSVAHDVGWQSGRDPVTCHLFQDGREVFTAQCGTRSSKQLTGVSPGTHSYYALVSDAFGVYSDKTNTVTINVAAPPTTPPPPPPAPKPSAWNPVVVVYGGGHVGMSFQVGWEAGRDPVTCHFFRDGVEVFTAQCGTSSSKQFYGVPAGRHSFYATVSDKFGVYSDPTATIVRDTT